VWPTLWPAAITVTLLSLTADALPAGLIPVLGHLAFGGLLYTAIFFLCGLDRDERRWFLSTFMALRNRYSPRLAADGALR
jgi:hypothetical protein